MRSVPEWIAEHDDQPVPPRVRLRVFQLYSGVCFVCRRCLRAGHWELDHYVALANGGKHRESNLRPVCTTPCHSNKTKCDVKQKGRNYRQQLFNAGIKRARPTFLTNKTGPLKKKMDGTVVKR